MLCLPKIRPLKSKQFYNFGFASSFVTYYFVYVYNLFTSIFKCYSVSVLFYDTHCNFAPFVYRQIIAKYNYLLFWWLYDSGTICTNEVSGAHICFD